MGGPAAIMPAPGMMTNMNMGPGGMAPVGGMQPPMSGMQNPMGGMNMGGMNMGGM